MTLKSSSVKLFKNNYSIVCHSLYTCLSSNALKVFVHIQTRHNAGNPRPFYESLATQSKILGLGKTTIQKAYDEMVELNVISIVSVKKKTTNLITINQPHEWKLKPLSVKSKNNYKGRSKSKSKNQSVSISGTDNTQLLEKSVPETKQICTSNQVDPYWFQVQSVPETTCELEKKELIRNINYKENSKTKKNGTIINLTSGELKELTSFMKTILPLLPDGFDFIDYRMFTGCIRELSKAGLSKEHLYDMFTYWKAKQTEAKAIGKTLYINTMQPCTEVTEEVLRGYMFDMLRAYDNDLLTEDLALETVLSNNELMEKLHDESSRTSERYVPRFDWSFRSEEVSNDSIQTREAS